MDAVTCLFPGPANRRTTRVGLEQELLTRDAETGSPVAPERVRSATSGAAGPQTSTTGLTCLSALYSPFAYRCTGTGTVAPARVTAS
jgi:hypothetical protein